MSNRDFNSDEDKVNNPSYYDMQIEGIKQVDYEYLTPEDNGND